ncbi:NarK family nitrate/nitrite MFS transporter [Pseudonocardiaceae bacterium YIM PH 21723]|nr:NarK family nitrate/nitrite MFS transporter [Pseudonocardiaceae bacterium YIM PH 21723]
MATGKWIEHWEPENPEFWAKTGKKVATRNLIFSIFAEHLGFSVWLLWSVVVVSLPKAGFTFTVDQLFWLVAVPNLVGSTLRLPYTFAVPKFGGRNWTVFSALALLLPTGLLAWAVSDPTTPFWVFLIVAATAGVGGGNFASSMTNINFFYPEKQKGFALGLNAAGGNLGVAVVQLGIPLVISIGTGIHLAYAGLVWAPFIILAAACAFFFMDNLKAAKSDFGAQIASTKRSQTWVMSFLYIGTFGSFIGYSAALPLLIKTQFPSISVADFAFLGALVGSVARPAGGWLADRFGGAKVTLFSFLVMGIGAFAVLEGVAAKSFPLFLGAFMLLFIASGAGNGSTYRMIPAIFAAQGNPKAEAGAAIGIASAIGAFGGFFVPRFLGMSLASTHSVASAFYGFVGFYAICLAVTWWCYLRSRVLVSVAPSLAPAAV